MLYDLRGNGSNCAGEVTQHCVARHEVTSVHLSQKRDPLFFVVSLEHCFDTMHKMPCKKGTK